MSAIAADLVPAGLTLGGRASGGRVSGGRVSGGRVRRDPARGAAASSPVGTGTSLRLTRRGRLVFMGIGLVLVGGVVVGGGWAAADAPRNGRPIATHTVAQGETLWAIAARLATPADDVREIVDDLVQLNGLSSPELRAGQQILVPTSA